MTRAVQHLACRARPDRLVHVEFGDRSWHVEPYRRIGGRHDGRGPHRIIRRAQLPADLRGAAGGMAARAELVDELIARFLENDLQVEAAGTRGGTPLRNVHPGHDEAAIGRSPHGGIAHIAGRGGTYPRRSARRGVEIHTIDAHRARQAGVGIRIGIGRRRPGRLGAVTAVAVVELQPAVAHDLHLRVVHAAEIEREAQRKLRRDVVVDGGARVDRSAGCAVRPGDARVRGRIDPVRRRGHAGIGRRVRRRKGQHHPQRTAR